MLVSDSIKSAIITGIFTLIVGILGTLWGINAKNVSVFVNGTEVKVNTDAYQSINTLESQNNS